MHLIALLIFSFLSRVRVKNNTPYPRAHISRVCAQRVHPYAHKVRVYARLLPISLLIRKNIR